MARVLRCRTSCFILLGILILLVGCTEKEYSVSGRVTDSAGNGISEVNLYIGYPVSATVTTDANGYWRAKVAGSPEVQASKYGYTFSPQKIQISENRPTASFKGTYSVSGVVRDEKGQGLEGVRINFSGEYGSVTTDKNGNWEKSGLAGRVTVVPTKQPYSFNPETTAIAGPSHFIIEARKVQQKINYREVESNNQREVANKIEVNRTYVGNLETKKDVDYYVFSLKSPGSIVVNFDHDLFDDANEYWTINLTNDAGTITYYSMKACGKPKAVATPKIRLPVGDYSIRITNHEPSSWQSYHSDRDYYLTVHHTAEGADFEKEFNDSFANATVMPLNQKVTGNLFKREDVDFYKFQLTEPGKVVIQFGHELFDNTNTFWVIQLLDDSLTRVIYKFYSEGKPAEVATADIRLPAGDYYLKITDYTPSSWQRYHSNRDYYLLTRYTEEREGFEREFNDSFANATPISFNRKITGNLYKREDVDFYKFQLTKPGKVVIQFGHELFDNTNTFWTIQLLDDSLTRVIHKFYSQGKPAEVASGDVQLPAGEYYLKITNYEPSSWQSYYSDREYNFTIQSQN